MRLIVVNVVSLSRALPGRETHSRNWPRTDKDAAEDVAMRLRPTV